MPRSCGAQLVISWSSSTIWPRVTFSKPAIRLSVVVLPQPEGPSRVTNEGPGICSETSLTACTGPNDFAIPRSVTLLMHLSGTSLVLDAFGQAAHDVAVEH